MLHRALRRELTLQQRRTATRDRRAAETVEERKASAGCHQRIINRLASTEERQVRLQQMSANQCVRLVSETTKEIEIQRRQTEAATV